jgi:4-oxalocrotonate tautomerase
MSSGLLGFQPVDARREESKRKYVDRAGGEHVESVKIPIVHGLSAQRAGCALAVSFRYYGPDLEKQGRQMPRLARNARPQHRRRMMPEVVVYMLEGRTLAQKRGLIKDITDAVVKNAGAKPEAVTVSLVESPKTSKGKGGVLFSEMS